MTKSEWTETLSRFGCYLEILRHVTVKPVKRPLSKRPKIGFHDQLSLIAGQKFLTFIKLPFVIESFVLSIFEWPFYRGFTVPLL